MLHARKAMFGCTASALALAIAVPAHAQDTTQTPADAQTSVTPGQIEGEVGPAQERSGTTEGEEIIVTGIRASIQASLEAKRENTVVSEVITAQDIGKFPDKNVADSLGRLTGVNVVTGSASAGGFGENQSVSIRGTDPALNLTLLDGHSIATGDWFVLDQTAGGRSFDFSLLPSEIVGSLEVYKSAQADIPEGGVGGTINIHSRKPLDLPAGSLSLTAQGNYNDLSDKWAPQVSGLFSWKNDAESFGVLGTAFYQERYFRRDGQEFLGYTPYANFAGSGETVLAPNLIGASYFRQKRTRKGGTLTVQIKPSERFELDLTGLYSKLEANNVNVNSMAWISRVAGGNSTPGTDAYALEDYTITNGYLTAATWNGTTAAGGLVQGRVQDDIFRDAFSETWDLNADATFHASDNLTFTGQIGYTEGKGATTDTYAWETYWDTGVSYAIEGKGATVDYADLPDDPTAAEYLNNYYSWSWGGSIISPDKEFYASANAEYEFDDGVIQAIKVGGRYTNHKRAVDYDAYSRAGNGLYSGTKGVGLGTVFDGDLTPDDYNDRLLGLPGYSLADKQKVLDELATNGGRVFDFYPPSSFSVKEQTQAVYAMAKLGNDSNWRGNVGLRAVHTDLDTTQYSPNAPVLDIETIFGNYGAVRTSRDYWDWLPSANLTYNIRPDLLLRAGVARVMTRPGYAQLAGAFSLSDLALTGTAGGNPNLDPFRAWQFNLAGEWYYGPQSLLSINLFYLDIKSYITTTTTTQFFATQQHPDGANFLITAPVNGPGGTNKGVEVNWQQPIAYGFGVIANYTYADAKNDDGEVIDGNSKHTFNVTGYFENSLLSARLAYTFRSKFRSGIDRATPMWQDDFGSLDASLIVNVTEHVALTADAQNLTNEKLYYFVGDPSIPRAYYDNGRTFWLGAKLTF